MSNVPCCESEGRGRGPSLHKSFANSLDAHARTQETSEGASAARRRRTKKETDRSYYYCALFRSACRRFFLQINGHTRRLLERLRGRQATKEVEVSGDERRGAESKKRRRVVDKRTWLQRDHYGQLNAPRGACERES